MLDSGNGYRVIFYETDDGYCPVGEYLYGLKRTGPKDWARVVRTIGLLQEFGIQLRGPHSKPLGDGLFELKASAHRVVYFTISGPCFVLVHAFPKKTQKTPRSEIEMAKQRMKDYLKRNGGR